MKRMEDGIQYSAFEVFMSALFFQTYGGTNLALEDQIYWDEIQRLKKLAIGEVLPDGHCPICGAKVLGGEK